MTDITNSVYPIREKVWEQHGLEMIIITDRFQFKRVIVRQKVADGELNIYSSGLSSKLYYDAILNAFKRIDEWKKN